MVKKRKGIYRKYSRVFILCGILLLLVGFWGLSFGVVIMNRKNTVAEKLRLRNYQLQMLFSNYVISNKKDPISFSQIVSVKNNRINDELFQEMLGELPLKFFRESDSIVVVYWGDMSSNKNLQGQCNDFYFNWFSGDCRNAVFVTRVKVYDVFYLNIEELIIDADCWGCQQKLEKLVNSVISKSLNSYCKSFDDSLNGSIGLDPASKAYPFLLSISCNEECIWDVLPLSDSLNIDLIKSAFEKNKDYFELFTKDSVKKIYAPFNVYQYPPN